MKKIVKLGLLSVALLATAVANASEKLVVKVASKSSKMLSISLLETSKGETLSVKDFKGEVLFTDVLNKSDKYTKVFNFSELPLGLYFVESKEDTKVQVTPVLISADDVTLVDNSEKIYTAPEISFKGDAMKVLVKNYNKVPVIISIYDELGLLLSKSESNDNTLVFGHYYTGKLTTKKITVLVTEAEYSFTKEIKL